MELAPLSDPELVLPALAAVLGVRQLPGRTWLETLSGYLRARRLLLILDNCEHLIETCAQLAAELLAACPQIKILASSREPLGIGGESIYRVPSLSLPGPGPTGTATLLQSEAGRLFVARAAAVQPRFQMTEQNTAAIAQICRRLDGIPLALELAAARVRLFTVEQIAARLDDRFRLLTGGSRSALPRQQTLEALIDWSYDLLAPAEQALFRRLAVFAGGWTFEAAEALAGCAPLAPDAKQGAAGWNLIDLLDQLVNKSLVQVESDPQTGASRFRYLETIRQYARGKLLAAGEVEQARAAHLAFYADLAQQADQEIRGKLQICWLERLDTEHDNLRAALEWALQADPGQALALADDLVQFWRRRGYGSEGLRWLEAGLAGVASLPEAGPPAARPLTAGPLTASGEAQRQRSRARALTGQAELVLTQGAYHEAISIMAESVTRWRETGDQDGLAYALGMLGFQHSLVGNFKAASPLAQESLVLAEAVGNTYTAGLAFAILGREQVLLKHDYAAGRATFEEGLRRLRAGGNDLLTQTIVMGLGLASVVQGNSAEARRHLQESLRVFQSLGDRHFANICRSGLADIARLEGDFAQASALYVETAETWNEIGNLGAVARCLECLAFSAGAQTSRAPTQERAALIRRALVLCGAAESLRQTHSAAMMPEEVAEYAGQVAELRALAG